MLFYDLLISPIESIVDFVFLFITRKFHFLGMFGAIVGVSFIINILALPLYNIADAIKEKESALQKKMSGQIARIKKYFSGDERFMMIQTCYRQNNYHPLYAFKSSLSILIEIPFFIAAYHYLSNNPALKEVTFSFAGLSLNLGEPDRIFCIHGFYINILPIAMTLINLISSMVYTKKAPLKEQVQLYGLAAVFLVLLYDSPSGLVIYWICNNIFSLFKNLIQKQKNPGKIFHIIMSVFFVSVTALFILRLFRGHTFNLSVLLLILFFTAGFVLFPFARKLLAGKITICPQKLSFEPDFKLFLASCLALAVLAGFVLPSSIIATSPIEFSCLGETDNPVSYVKITFLYFMGLCVVWPVAIFKMFGEKAKRVMCLLSFSLLVCALFNVFVFKYDYGYMSQTFAFESIISLEYRSAAYTLLPLFVFAASGILFIVLQGKKIRGWTFTLVLSLCFAEAALGFYKTDFIQKKYHANEANLLAAKAEGKAKDIAPVFNLTKTGKNVVVIFLDRGISSFFPKILEAYPELKSSFDGFTWYPNTLSFGDFTTVGAPAMMGGYEYEPEEINKRSGELLRDKHNEATLVLPKLFLDAGWNVTVTDPPLPNYSEKTDLSAFEKFPQIKVSELAGRYTASYLERQQKSGIQVDGICRKQCKNFSLIQMLYPNARKYFYNVMKDDINETSFEHQYASLYFFNELTEFNSDRNSYFFIENDATHPDSDSPDWGKDGFLEESLIKKLYDFKDSKDLVHFRVNALCVRAVGKWLDYLKENGVYDNTRVILVSDHGRGIHLEEFKNFANYSAPAYFTALLCEKDFGSRGQLVTDRTFMMNADAPFMATKNLGISDVNPFTDKKMVQNKDRALKLYPAETTSTTKIYNNKTFYLDKKKGWVVSGDIFDEASWRRME